MKTEKNIENNLDEVTFENRNKEYGAYFLRKKYDKNVSRALTISVFLVLMTVVIPLIANYIDKDDFFRSGVQQGPEVMVLGSLKEEPPPPPPPPLPEKISEKIIFIAPKVVDDTTEQGTMFTQAYLNATNKNENFNDTFIKIDNDQTEKKIIDEGWDKVIHEYSGVEEKPEFIGGMAEMNIYIAENIKYPKLASENKIQGKVLIAFVVEADGSISNIIVKKSLGAGCDEEAERVIKMMPRWNPGKQNNKCVRVGVMIPIKFTIVY